MGSTQQSVWWEEVKMALETHKWLHWGPYVVRGQEFSIAARGGGTRCWAGTVMKDRNSESIGAIAKADSRRLV
jgi:hypothetical protein